MNMQDTPPKEPENGPRPDEGMLFNRMLKSRTVLVSGEINKPLAERVIRSLILLEEESADPIKVYIDSPGGDADAGYAIFDMMRFVKPKITMIGMGLVASAAAIIILAAPREQARRPPQLALPHPPAHERHPRVSPRRSRSMQRRSRSCAPRSTG